MFCCGIRTVDMLWSSKLFGSFLFQARGEIKVYNCHHPSLFVSFQLF
uniref:Uncharacterized protein n=1 Tax=Marseillevirus sp. TaxID=2809551 RepID=A0AA96IYC8_9VIRU|nr:hypothetical protein MarDSR_047 [Marseillevirus sp.]